MKVSIQYFDSSFVFIIGLKKKFLKLRVSCPMMK